MNEDTRVGVCCYAGDGDQVLANLGLYLHHGCPVTILSPEDSKVEIQHPGVVNRFGGKRAHVGQDSLDRERRHLEILLEFPEKYFMIHDADSVCLDPKFPDYLYAEPDLVWSNQVNNTLREHQPYFPKGWPHIAFQPPYFLSRKTIEALLAVADDPQCVASPMMPFIDHYMLQLTYTAGLPWKRLVGCVACQPHLARELVRRGVSIFHGIKDTKDMYALLDARRLYLAGKLPPAPAHGGQA